MPCYKAYLITDNVTFWNLCKTCIKLYEKHRDIRCVGNAIFSDPTQCDKCKISLYEDNAKDTEEEDTDPQCPSIKLMA